MPEYLDDPRPDPAALAMIAEREMARQYTPVVDATLAALRARKAHLDILIAMLEAERLMSNGPVNIAPGPVS